MTSTTERCGDGAVKEQNFCMFIEVRCYEFKLECYNCRMLNAIHIVNTKELL